MTRFYSVDPIKPSANTHFDWLTVVLPMPADSQRGGYSVREYISLILKKLYLGSYKWKQLNNGIYTYDFAETTANNSIIMGYSEDDLASNHDFMLQISGSGVESIESVFKDSNYSISRFVRDVLNYDGSFSRIDACVNYFNYPIEYSPRFVNDEARKGNLISTARRCKWVDNYSSKGAIKNKKEAYMGSHEGATLYIGHNPKQLRIYNKLAERSQKVNILYDCKSWFRWEFQLNGIQAQGFIDSYVDNGCDLVQTWIDYLASNFRFIEQVGTQKKRSRYPNATWFDEMIKNAKTKIKIRREKQLPTYQKANAWIDRQVMATLTGMYYARYQKYLQNGLTDTDAKKLAFKKIENDIFERVVNREFDESKVSSWLSERGLATDLISETENKNDQKDAEAELIKKLLYENKILKSQLND